MRHLLDRHPKKQLTVAGPSAEIVLRAIGANTATGPNRLEFVRGRSPTGVTGQMAQSSELQRDSARSSCCSATP
ncbi:MAG: hypothetical protein ABEN55_07105, partial [Bradymonadaceae bacterium]